MGIIDHKKIFTHSIKNKKEIFIMGHKNLDLDALGSAIGLYMFLKKKHKDCYIIIDDRTHELGVEKILTELEGCVKFIRSDTVEKYMYPNPNRNLLIIVDTNKLDLLQNKEVFKFFKHKLIIDHHEIDKNTIKNVSMIIDTNSSSACEMITELIEYYDIEIEPYYATILLAGIVLDTSNFTLKTSPDTYYAAYYLSNLGASAKKVQYLMKQNIEDYNDRQKLLSDIETINNRIAFSKGTPYSIYRREDIARIADTLLFFNNIEASFVIGKIDKNTIGISGRSLGNYDIGKIMVKLGGGGTVQNGAAQFEKTTISKVEEKLKKILEETGE